MVRRRRTASKPLSDDAASLLDRFSVEVQEIILRLRERVFAFDPSLHEIIVDARYTVSLLYGPDETAGHIFCYIAGFSNHANLGFQRGASLPDPESVMEGTGTRMRHIKFFSPAQTEATWLNAYLAAALAQSRQDDNPSRQVRHSS